MPSLALPRTKAYLTRLVPRHAVLPAAKPCVERPHALTRAGVAAFVQVTVKDFKDKFLRKPYIINLMEELTLKGITQVCVWVGVGNRFLCSAQPLSAHRHGDTAQGRFWVGPACGS